jgi:hypothetical protein
LTTQGVGPVLDTTVGRVQQERFASNCWSQSFYTGDDYFLTTSHEEKGHIGADTPNFYRKLRTGSLLPINFFDQVERYAALDSSDRMWHNYTTCQGNPVLSHHNWDEGVGHLFDDGDFSVPWKDEYINGAKTAAVVQSAASNLASATMDSLTTLAELHKTAGLFRNAGKSLSNVLSNVSPLQWAQTWLEGRYGWRQVKFDFQNLNDAIKESQVNHVQVYRDSAHDSSSGSSLDLLHTKIRADTTFEIERRIDWNTSYRGIALSHIRPANFGFNPIVTAWELIPFSFVVDWFVSVGSTLGYWSGRVTHPNMITGVGHLVDVTMTVYYDDSTIISQTRPSTGWHNITEEAHITGTATFTKREPMAPPVIPVIRNRIDDLKVIDLLALIVQQLTRFKRLI